MVTIGILCQKAHIFTNGAIQQFYFIYRVLQNCGLDPNEHQGFAFGMGIERVAMLK